MSHTYSSGVIEKIYHTASDNLCPHCHSTNIVKIGELHIDGGSQDSHKCNSCNAVFSMPMGATKQLLDKLQMDGFGEASKFVTFTSTQGTMDHNSLSSSNNVEINGMYDLKSKIDQTNNKLNDIDNNFDMLKQSIDDLVVVIRGLAYQNKELLEKTLTDPLINIKKQINEFQLK